MVVVVGGLSFSRDNGSGRGSDASARAEPSSRLMERSVTLHSVGFQKEAFTRRDKLNSVKDERVK
jgi:hypothetical protein